MQIDKFMDNVSWAFELFLQLDKEMDSLESKMLAKKPWYLQGETSGKDRTDNALLSEHFEVQRHAIYSKNKLQEVYF